jgi:hypothetical protein
VSSGATRKRSLQTEDRIEIQLGFQISKAVDWGPVRVEIAAPKRLVQIETELSYFSGEIVETSSSPFGVRDDEFKNRVFREFLIDCGVPIMATDVFRNDDPLQVSSGSCEGLAHLWGFIGFHQGHLMKTVRGKIVTISELTPVLLSRGQLILRRVTIDIANDGAVVNRLEQIDPLRRRGDQSRASS